MHTCVGWTNFGLMKINRTHLYCFRFLGTLNWLNTDCTYPWIQRGSKFYADKWFNYFENNINVCEQISTQPNERGDAMCVWWVFEWNPRNHLFCNQSIHKSILNGIFQLLHFCGFCRLKLETSICSSNRFHKFECAQFNPLPINSKPFELLQPDSNFILV